MCFKFVFIQEKGEKLIINTHTYTKNLNTYDKGCAR